MEKKEFWNGLDKDKREALSTRTKTTVGYLILIFGGHQMAGPGLAKRLEQNILELGFAQEGEITKAQFRPDLWGTPREQQEQADHAQEQADRVNGVASRLGKIAQKEWAG